ncbi:hypothetical protein DRJ16_00140, partial [Candidatus Woesearchaeota archaeon]
MSNVTIVGLSYEDFVKKYGEEKAKQALKQVYGTTSVEEAEAIEAQKARERRAVFFSEVKPKTGEAKPPSGVAFYSPQTGFQPVPKPLEKPLIELQTEAEKKGLVDIKYEIKKAGEGYEISGKGRRIPKANIYYVKGGEEVHKIQFEEMKKQVEAAGGSVRLITGAELRKEGIYFEHEVEGMKGARVTEIPKSEELFYEIKMPPGKALPEIAITPAWFIKYQKLVEKVQKQREKIAEKIIRERPLVTFAYSLRSPTDTIAKLVEKTWEGKTVQEASAEIIKERMLTESPIESALGGAWGVAELPVLYFGGRYIPQAIYYAGKVAPNVATLAKTGLGLLTIKYATTRGSEFYEAAKAGKAGRVAGLIAKTSIELGTSYIGYRHG